MSIKKNNDVKKMLEFDCDNIMKISQLIDQDVNHPKDDISI